MRYELNEGYAILSGNSRWASLKIFNENDKCIESYISESCFALLEKIEEKRKC